MIPFDFTELRFPRISIHLASLPLPLSLDLSYLALARPTLLHSVTIERDTVGYLQAELRFNLKPSSQWPPSIDLVNCYIAALLANHCHLPLGRDFIILNLSSCLHSKIGLTFVLPKKLYFAHWHDILFFHTIHYDT